MTDSPAESTTPALSPDKLLALGAYGETVAAYRYLVLSEKAAGVADRRLFAEMADEEQGHKQRLQKLLAERYPDANFVLTTEDKELVITGPRLLDVHREVSFPEALAMMLQTERKVAEFYARHGDTIVDPDLRTIFRQLAHESAEHHHQLQDLARQARAGGTQPDGMGPG